MKYIVVLIQAGNDGKPELSIIGQSKSLHFIIRLEDYKNYMKTILLLILFHLNTKQIINAVLIKVQRNTTFIQERSLAQFWVGGRETE